MSQRSLVELNHDYCPSNDADLLAWARKMQTYMRSAMPAELPDGVTWKHGRHHSDPDPMQNLAVVMEEIVRDETFRTSHGTGAFKVLKAAERIIERLWALPQVAP